MRDPMRSPPRAGRFVPLLALGVLTVLVPGLYGVGVLDITAINQLGRFLALAIVAVGLDLVWGYTGILSLCQAMFFCFGGYAMGMYMAMHGPLSDKGVPRVLTEVSSDVGGMTLPLFWEPFGSFWFALGAVVLVPGLAALAFGWLTFRSRVRGVYFSIITQATTIAVWLIFCRNETKLCGTNGLNKLEQMFGYNMTTPGARFAAYLVTVAALAATWAFARWLIASRTGRVLVAIRDNESRLRFAGYQPVAYKTFIFTVGAVLAGIGGALYVPQNGIITPAKMEAIESITMVVWVAVGGRGTLSGAIIGAVVVNYLQSVLTTLAPNAWLFVLGAIFVAVVLFLPTGLTGLWAQLFPAGGGKVPDDDARADGGAVSAPASVQAKAAP
ncbi:MAG: urea ABC transporter permease subunit UrtC [Planctomycetes bacterium]|nr:urea ABC transporter permease subunit UrtC [Planctomycetota bacterium]